MEEVDILGSEIGVEIEAPDAVVLDDFYVTLFSSIQDFYERKIFCDLNIYCQPEGEDQEDESKKAIRCHSLILASVVPAIKNLLKLSEWDPAQEADCLYLPDISYHVMKEFVDQIYVKLSEASDVFELQVDKDIANVLGLITGLDYVNCDKEAVKFIPQDAIPRTSTGEIDYDAFNKNAHIAKAVKAQTAATQAKTNFNAAVRVSESGSNPFLKDSTPPQMSDIIQIVDGKVNVSQGPGTHLKPLEEIVKESQPSVSPSKVSQKRKADTAPVTVEPKKQPLLPSPAIFANEPKTKYSTTCNVFNRSCFHRIENAAFGFIRNNGIFRAVTQPYYATPKITDDKSNIMITAEGAARQFRMKLPDKAFVALVAVGMR